MGRIARGVGRVGNPFVLAATWLSADSAHSGAGETRTKLRLPWERGGTPLSSTFPIASGTPALPGGRNLDISGPTSCLSLYNDCCKIL